MSYSNNPSPECPGPNCQMCNGEMCGLCGAGCWDTTASKCEHGSIDRHADPMFGPASTPVQTLPVADPRDARIAELERIAYIGEHHHADLTWKARCEETQRQLDEARALVEEVSFALHSPSDDPEHDIHSHAESLPALYRTACNSIAAAQDVISGYVIDRLALAAKEDGNG